jgi:CHASE3 domain sensor protein
VADRLGEWMRTATEAQLADAARDAKARFLAAVADWDSAQKAAEQAVEEFRRLTEEEIRRITAEARQLNGRPV